MLYGAVEWRQAGSSSKNKAGSYEHADEPFQQRREAVAEAPLEQQRCLPIVQAENHQQPSLTAEAAPMRLVILTRLCS